MFRSFLTIAIALLALCQLGAHQIGPCSLERSVILLKPFASITGADWQAITLHWNQGSIVKNVLGFMVESPLPAKEKTAIWERFAHEQGKRYGFLGWQSKTLRGTQGEYVCIGSRPDTLLVISADGSVYRGSLPDGLTPEALKRRAQPWDVPYDRLTKLLPLQHQP